MVHYDLVLHDVCRNTIIHDLSIFFRDELGKIRAEFEAEFGKLPFDWPGDDIIDSLVHKADGLFIYAVTVCRFIRNNDMCFRRDLLKLFVTDRSNANSPEIEPTELPSKTPTSELDEIYMQILNHSQRKVDKERKKQLSMAFKKIVGTIVILSETLSTAALAKLLAMEKERITIRLRTLRSVLNVPEDTVSPIRLLHPSFRDFLLDKKGALTNTSGWTRKKHIALCLRAVYDLCPANLRETFVAYAHQAHSRLRSAAIKHSNVFLQSFSTRANTGLSIFRGARLSFMTTGKSTYFCASTCFTGLKLLV